MFIIEKIFRNISYISAVIPLYSKWAGLGGRIKMVFSTGVRLNNISRIRLILYWVLYIV